MSTLKFYYDNRPNTSMRRERSTKKRKLAVSCFADTNWYLKYGAVPVYMNGICPKASSGLKMLIYFFCNIFSASHSVYKKIILQYFGRMSFISLLFCILQSVITSLTDFCLAFVSFNIRLFVSMSLLVLISSLNMYYYCYPLALTVWMIHVHLWSLRRLSVSFAIFRGDIVNIFNVRLSYADDE